MDESEARALLADCLLRFRRRSYGELRALVGDGAVEEVRGVSGAAYTIEVTVFWDAQPGGNIGVLGSIDDGGWRAFVPCSDDFLVAPDGSLVGE